jgi:XTP/dITP diphosphohydrolase
LETTLYCATSNADKIREFRLALANLYRVEKLAAVPAPEETGSTFEENAILKAIYYSLFCDDPVFVDDSGIEVDALGGEPGVYSARYAGPAASDEENNQLLLERMRGITDRTARFVCVIALAQQGHLIRTFRGAVEGRIADAPKGNKGFGYDPLFCYPPFGCTFGEIGREMKTTVSHRGKALREMVGYLRG